MNNFGVPKAPDDIYGAQYPPEFFVRFLKAFEAQMRAEAIHREMFERWDQLEYALAANLTSSTGQGVSQNFRGDVHAHTLVIDNPTGYLLRERALNRLIAPNTLGQLVPCIPELTKVRLDVVGGSDTNGGSVLVTGTEARMWGGSSAGASSAAAGSNVTVVGPLGQLAMAASVSVVVASNQTSLPVTVGNFPATQPISGAVSVSNFPATQPVSGTVSVSNFPATQPISGAVTVTSGSVSVSALPALAAGTNIIGLAKLVDTGGVNVGVIDANNNLRVLQGAPTVALTGGGTSAAAQAQVAAAQTLRKVLYVINLDATNTIGIGNTGLSFANSLKIPPLQSAPWEVTGACFVLDDGTHHCAYSFADYHS